MDNVWTGFVCVSDVDSSASYMMQALSSLGEALLAIIVK